MIAENRRISTNFPIDLCMACGRFGSTVYGGGKRRALDMPPSPHQANQSIADHHQNKIAGGFAVGDLLKKDFGLHDPLQNAVAGVVGGVIGVKILQHVPALNGFDIVPIVGQAIVAFACGAASTVVAGLVIRWCRQRTR